MRRRLHGAFSYLTHLYVGTHSPIFSISNGLNLSQRTTLYISEACSDLPGFLPSSHKLKEIHKTVFTAKGKFLSLASMPGKAGALVTNLHQMRASKPTRKLNGERDSGQTPRLQHANTHSQRGSPLIQTVR